MAHNITDSDGESAEFEAMFKEDAPKVIQEILDWRMLQPLVLQGLLDGPPSPIEK